MWQLLYEYQVISYTTYELCILNMKCQTLGFRGRVNLHDRSEMSQNFSVENGKTYSRKTKIWYNHFLSLVITEKLTLAPLSAPPLTIEAEAVRISIIQEFGLRSLEILQNFNFARKLFFRVRGEIGLGSLHSTYFLLNFSCRTAIVRKSVGEFTEREGGWQRNSYTYKMEESIRNFCLYLPGSAGADVRRMRLLMYDSSILTLVYSLWRIYCRTFLESKVAYKHVVYRIITKKIIRTALFAPVHWGHIDDNCRVFRSESD